MFYYTASIIYDFFDEVYTVSNNSNALSQNNNGIYFDMKKQDLMDLVPK